MKHWMRLAAAGLAVLLAAGSPASAATVVKIPAGTPVSLKLDQTVDSKTAQTGQKVRFSVLNDVKVKGRVVIKAGTQAIGEVVHARDAGMLGTAGALHIAVRTVEAVDGTPVVLDSRKGTEGKDKMVQSVGIAMLCCIFALFMKGKEATMEAGALFDAMVVAPVEVTTE